jgi:hypothetical protein
MGKFIEDLAVVSKIEKLARNRQYEVVNILNGCLHSILGLWGNSEGVVAKCCVVAEGF